VLNRRIGMRIIAAIAAISAPLLLIASQSGPIEAPVERVTPHAGVVDVALATPSNAELTDVVQTYCVRCHSERRLTGNLTLEDFDVESAADLAATSEKMIRKLRAGMMPPAGARRPSGDTLLILVQTLEENIDEAAKDSPNPGSRVFQRLNQAEYERSIEALLGLTVDASEYLPADTKSANFDNVADVQMMSPTLMGAYLNAASEVARLAVGDPNPVESEATYRIPRMQSQRDRVPGAPYGSRGGVSEVHNFPADGTYNFKLSFHYSPEGILYGRNEPGEQLEVSINGERAALLPLDRFTAEEDPGGMGLMLETGPIPVRAGPQRISAVFIPKERGPVDDLFSAHGNSIADTQIGIGYGLQMLPHMRDLVIRGPVTVTGVSDTPTRQAIFTCRPTSREEATPCAEEIVTRIATAAYRRPLEAIDIDGLMGFYHFGAQEGGFEMGVRAALEAVVASPHFVFRIEEAPDGVEPGEIYPVSDLALASRLSFFLWGSPPDEELLELARREQLQKDRVLRRQTERMLADPRAEALGTRFASQWLRLQDVKKLHPDVVLFPDYDLRLANAMERETELFFYHLVRADRPVLEMLTADYTFVDERLAEHYDIPGVIGDDFRLVNYPNEQRQGILGHGSVLAQTSLANRTSPVNRGKWVAEVLLGSPPPPPPPNVPSLDESVSGAGQGRLLTTRERMELHRQNPTCNACHRLIDPIGLAMDNFDVTGRWRIRENGMPVDPGGELYDGTPLSGPADLNAALLNYRIPFLRNFTSNLMTYALGRRVEYFDMPEIRNIVREAESEEYRTSAFILGVVASDAFRMKRAATSVAMDAGN
jgi:hypothetical protein